LLAANTMTNTDKATGIQLFSFSTPAMRAFHLAWSAFFLCFFGWFGIAPLMAYVRDDLHLTKEQVGNTMIASVLATIFARLVVGFVCDRFGPRIVYTWLLLLGALPVMGIGLAQDYWSFLLFRLAIGAVGAAFVVTQYHTSQMFAPNVVGTANATTAGWGNMGGGVTQMVMPLIVAGLLGLGYSAAQSWRLAMIVPGLLMWVAAYFYGRCTQDTPAGNFSQLPERRVPGKSKAALSAFAEAARDIRVWALFVIYGACFGIEITIHNVAALYFIDTFKVSVERAGLIAGSFGVLALFARSLGGYGGDRASRGLGLRGRALFLGAVLFCEGLALLAFSQAHALPLAVALLLIFGLFVHLSAGATYSVVPFINKRALGAVSGIVGAGGNVGAVLASTLFRNSATSSTVAFAWLGVTVLVASSCALLIRFKQSEEIAAARPSTLPQVLAASPMAAE
jgi:NNP family nitrate/nitrite transporter-like MFS transporter